MALENNLTNIVWLIANNKESEFETFCKRWNLQIGHPVSLQFFKNHETVEVRK